MATRLFVGAGKLSRNAQDARAAFRDLDATLNAMDIPEAVFEAYVEDAARFVTPQVRAAMLAQYERSGIGKREHEGYKHSGWLKKAISALTVRPGKRSLQIRFPSGIAPVPDETNPRNPYMVAASLQYGSVRTGGQALGAKAKRTFKTRILAGQELTKRQLSALHRGIRQVHSGKTIERKGVDISKLSVTRPWRFFMLDASSKDALYRLFIGRLKFLIERRRQRAGAA
jgi:hypothetical protein